MFEAAKRKDAEEDKLYGKDRRGDETPEAWATKEGRLKWILEAKANVTDPQSRIMKTRSGYVQGYNAQAAVTENQIIVAAEVTQEYNDVGQLHPMVEKVAENLKAVGAPEAMETVLADAGYWSDANMAGADPVGPELLIATNKDWKQRKAMREAPPPRGRIAADMTARERMERKLLTKRGRALYKLRGQTIEPTFGQIKDGRGCDGFMRRGVKATDSEWSLLCMSHNLLKLWRSGKVKIRQIGTFLRSGPEILAPVYA